MDIKRDILSRIGVIYACVFLFGLGVIGRIVYIQFFDDSVQTHAEMISQKAPIKPKRGDIYSRDGKVLACSVPEYVVYFDYRIPAFAKSDTLFRKYVDQLAAGLARVFAHEGKSKQQYLKELHSTAQNKSFLRLHRRPIDYNTLQEVKKLPILEYGPYKGGLLVDVYNSRVYPYGDMAKRTIGLIRKGSFHGVTGLELFYDQYLYGIENSLSMSDYMENNGTIDGYDVITTIDTEVQSIVNEELMKALYVYKGSWGCAVVMEVNTGEILAISNLSRTIINNDTLYQELENIAADFRSDPGSTIKLPSLLVALEDGVVQLDDTIQTGNGKTRFYGLDVVDWNHATHGGFGKLSVKDVFANSSNVGVTKIIHANYIHPKREWDFITRLQSMGLNKITGIDLSKEREPLVKDPSMTTKNDKYKWYGTTLVSMAYGYEIELTPLQLLNFYNAIANNGVMVKPRLVKEIKSGTHSILKTKTEITNNAVVSKATLEKAHELLNAVITTGTAKAIHNKYYAIAGKTGSAQTIINNRYNDRILRGSFCGYFPANQPKYSCIIVMQSSLPYDPYRVSGTTTAHVFKKIADRIYFSDHELRNQLSTDSSMVFAIPEMKKGYTDDFTRVFSQLSIPYTAMPAGEWTNLRRTTDSVEPQLCVLNTETIPDLRGMGVRDAVFLAENAGLRVSVKGYGKVYKQSLPPGTAIRKGDKIVLELK